MSLDSPRAKGSSGRQAEGRDESSSKGGFVNPSNPPRPQLTSFAPPPLPSSLNLSTSLTTSKSTTLPLSYPNPQSGENLTYSTRANGFVVSNPDRDGPGGGLGGGKGAWTGVAQAGGFRIDYESNTGFSRERDGEEVYALWAH